MILAGCATETKQKWLTFFFDGVPQPGATNAVAKTAVAPVSTTNATGQVTVTTPAAPARPPLIVHPPYAQRDCK